MKKIVKSMTALLMVAGFVVFMGCKQTTSDFGTEEITLQKGVKKLPAGTDGTYGKEGTYVEFGYWPQSKKVDEVKLGTKITNVNGWSCLTGSDGAYYVKVKAAPHYAPEAIPDAPKKIYKFDDGTTIEKDKEYYFKLEPIKWRVLTDDYKIPDGNGEYKSSNRKLLFAEKVLFKCDFYLDSYYRWEIKSNNYEYSIVRAYLNGLNGSSYYAGDFTNNGFLQKAFSPAEINSISITEVDNSDASTFCSGETVCENPYACANTKDKIFLLSKKEITEKEYGFGQFNNEENAKRIRKTTDYARAIGVWIDKNDKEYKNNSRYWTRTPNDYDWSFVQNKCLWAQIIKTDGHKGTGFTDNLPSSNDFGVVPALSMTF